MIDYSPLQLERFLAVCDWCNLPDCSLPALTDLITQLPEVARIVIPAAAIFLPE